MVVKTPASNKARMLDTLSLTETGRPPREALSKVRMALRTFSVC
jgi:hypothetical protein